jgi:DNA-directed RNA polymerase sigma subunit (sigma70/sigma32)
MVGAANECLINCVLNFSTSKGYRLYAYLYSAITNTLVKLVNLHRPISLPQHLYLYFAKIENGYPESFSDKRLREYEMYSKFLYLRFSDENEEGHDFDIMDSAIEKVRFQKETAEEVGFILSGLSEVELYIVINYFGLQNTKQRMLKDIVTDLKMKPGSVSAAKARALVKMGIKYKKLQIKKRKL